MKNHPIHRTALHEAGHAVMHLFLRLDNLDAVSIVPDSRKTRLFDSSGRCRIRYAGDLAIAAAPRSRDSAGRKLRRRARLKLRKVLFMVCAGGEGELLFPKARSPGDWSDFQHHAIPICDSLFGKKTGMSKVGSYFDGALRGRVRRLVRGKLREPIEKFAAVLLERKELDSEEAHDIICSLLGIGQETYWRDGHW